jgi:hypothetical protein
MQMVFHTYAGIQRSRITKYHMDSCSPGRRNDGSSSVCTTGEKLIWMERILERETGIEPATNGLGSRYSTIELLPLAISLYPITLS